MPTLQQCCQSEIGLYKDAQLRCYNIKAESSKRVDKPDYNIIVLYGKNATTA